MACLELFWRKILEFLEGLIKQENGFFPWSLRPSKRKDSRDSETHLWMHFPNVPICRKNELRSPFISFYNQVLRLLSKLFPLAWAGNDEIEECQDVTKSSCDARRLQDPRIIPRFSKLVGRSSKPRRCWGGAWWPKLHQGKQKRSKCTEKWRL